MTSCASDGGKTVAGGANGKIDYCVRVFSMELLCIHAERQMETKPKEEEP